MAWRNSEAKAYLKSHLEADEDNWIKKIVAEEGVNAKSIEKIRNRNELFLQYNKSNFITNFKNLKSAIAKGTAEKKVEEWRNSEAKAYLKLHLESDVENWIKKIVAEEGVNGKSIEKIRNGHKLFLQYDKTKFITNFKNLKSAIEHEAIEVAFDQKAFEKESQKYNDELMLKRGYPKWDHRQNNAKELLAADLRSDGVNMTPKQLQASRPEYAAYPEKVFRDRVYREKRTKKETPYWQYRRNNYMRNQKVKEMIEKETLESAMKSLSLEALPASTDSDHNEIANV